jgi:plasmid maintenance system antidote protein VapI
MSPLTKMQTFNGKPMPHMGNMLAQLLKERRLTKTWLARKLNVHQSGIGSYLKQPSLHAALLWKLGEIFELDFFAMLSNEFPLHKQSQLELQQQQQIAELKKENELYKNLLMGKLG